MFIIQYLNFRLVKLQCFSVNVSIYFSVIKIISRSYQNEKNDKLLKLNLKEMTFFKQKGSRFINIKHKSIVTMLSRLFEVKGIRLICLN